MMKLKTLETDPWTPDEKLKLTKIFDRMELFSECFYLLAWSLLYFLNGHKDFKGIKDRYKGINRVRNGLLMHTPDKAIYFGTGWSDKNGPQIKVGKNKKQIDDKHMSPGLYLDAKEMLSTLSQHLSNDSRA